MIQKSNKSFIQVNPLESLKISPQKPQLPDSLDQSASSHKRKQLPPETNISCKAIFQIGEEIRTFHNKNTLGNLRPQNPVLQKLLKDVLERRIQAIDAKMSNEMNTPGRKSSQEEGKKGNQQQKIM